MNVKVKSRLLAVVLTIALLMGLAPSAWAANELTVTAEAGKTSITVGETVQLSITAGTTTGSISWTSSDASVAAVGGDGKVTGVSAGTATITVTDGSDPVLTGSISITVTDPTPVNVPVTGVTLNKSTLSLAIGSSETLTATVAPTTATEQGVTWSSSSPAIATINASGAITALQTGTAVMTATTTDGGKTASCTVTVTAASSTTPTLSSTSTSVKVGNTVSLSVNNRPSGATVAWTSNNTGRATVSSAGVVTGVAAGSVTITATVTNSDGTTTTLTCTVTVTNNSTTPDVINYSVETDGSVTFSASDFNSVCSAVTGNNLSYVKFSLPATNRGTLYYEYDDGDYDHKVTAAKSYYRTGTSNALGKVTLVPYSGYTGNFNISYTAYSTGNENFTGTITIKVSKNTTITYKVAENKVVEFSASDFNSLCKDATGSNLSYVKFTLPSSTKGNLYYDYDDGDYGHAVTASKSYYRSTSSGNELDLVSFEPKKNYTGTVSINFTGYTTGSESFSGTIKIVVGDGDAGDIKYTGSQGKNISFSASDFNSLCKDETGSNLSYVKFTLPNSTKGKLYYDYSSNNNYDHAVAANRSYYRSVSSSSSNYALDDVTFVPASGVTGKVEIDFTGYSTDGDSFNGTIIITYSAAGNASAISYNCTGDVLTFNKNDFITACSKRGGAALKSVKFTLPSNYYGTLYYAYVNATSFGGLVSASTSFDTGTGTYSLSNVSFVPSAGYSGNVSISYTATDEDNITYTGTITIAVTQTQPTEVFTDMANHSWALAAVNALYQKGVVTGMTATTYGPAGNIKRGDFILMLYRAFNLSATTTDNFSDVPSDAYYASAIAVAKALGIAQGGDGVFRPEASLTREDAMVLIHRTLEVAKKTVNGTTTTTIDSFPDAGDTSSYAKDAVDALVRAGVVTGDNTGKLNPKGALTRAEMAVILYRVIG